MTDKCKSGCRAEVRKDLRATAAFFMDKETPPAGWQGAFRFAFALHAGKRAKLEWIIIRLPQQLLLHYWSRFQYNYQYL